MTSVKVVDGKHCPKCGVDIGVWSVFSAAWPTMIWCPSCKTRLRYRHVFTVGLVMLLASVVLAAGSFAVVLALGRYLTGMLPILVWAGLVLGGWVPVELVSAWFLRKYRELDFAVPQDPDL